MQDETSTSEEAVAKAPKAPVSAAERFESLDVLRGIAVLGIAMVNVQIFFMAPNAYPYPPAHMDISGVNGQAWLFMHIFFELKFITLFSALFGAGIVMMVGEDKDAPRALHYSRMRWLLLIGLIHGFGLWFGDILTTYAIAGFIVVAFRHMSPTKLIVWGMIWTTLTGLIWFAMFGSFLLIPDRPLDPVEFGLSYDQEQLDEIVGGYQAGYLESRRFNAINMALNLSSIVLFGGRIIGVMFLGMALFKLGFLTARWSVPAYLASAVIGFGLGFPIVAVPAQQALETGFQLHNQWQHYTANYFASLFIAFGYASVVMVVCKLPILKLIRAPFAAAGRMAFTNYLTQTLTMVFLSVGGLGLGWFGTVERIEQVQIVLMIWLVQLIVSPIWLSVFRFGPFEWLWRSLSYRRLQPFLKG